MLALSAADKQHTSNKLACAEAGELRLCPCERGLPDFVACGQVLRPDSFIKTCEATSKERQSHADAAASGLLTSTMRWSCRTRGDVGGPDAALLQLAATVRGVGECGSPFDSADGLAAHLVRQHGIQLVQQFVQLM